MDTNLSVTPEAAGQLLEIFKSRRLAYRTLTKQPEKVMRQVLKDAELLNTSEWFGVLQEKEDVAYYRADGCIFEIHCTPDPMVVKVELAKPLRKERNKRATAAHNDRQRAAAKEKREAEPPTIGMNAVGIRRLGITNAPKRIKLPPESEEMTEEVIEPVEPPFDLAKARFSQHALERFSERFPEKVVGGVEESALALLSKATEYGAISKVGYVVRTIDNQFEEARYFRIGRCRFVVQEQLDGTYEILTIEHAYLK